jgi:hypothetical protein
MHTDAKTNTSSYLTQEQGRQHSLTKSLANFQGRTTHTNIHNYYYHLLNELVTLMLLIACRIFITLLSVAVMQSRTNVWWMTVIKT